PLALVPAGRGRPRGRPRAVGEDLALPVQGRRELLLRARRRRAPPRPRLDVSRPDPGRARHRRAGLLLRREGGADRGLDAFALEGDPEAGGEARARVDDRRRLAPAVLAGG